MELLVNLSTLLAMLENSLMADYPVFGVGRTQQSLTERLKDHPFDACSFTSHIDRDHETVFAVAMIGNPHRGSISADPFHLKKEMLADEFICQTLQGLPVVGERMSGIGFQIAIR